MYLLMLSQLQHFLGSINSSLINCTGLLFIKNYMNPCSLPNYSICPQCFLRLLLKQYGEQPKAKCICYFECTKKHYFKGTVHF
uniref:Secreted protein n=1 Tax=Pyxicephalus adspersus TaxID=30357 RepID=A0AAV3AN81_PYXAD|nr:TPA: hypothetical protein GDO54_010238 [Pyxicephalus adspersus]